LLFFNPGKVKVKNDKEETEVVVLNSLKNIGRLFKSPITDFRTGFTNNSSEEALNYERKEEAPHWVWIDTQICGLYKPYAQQLDMAKYIDKKTYLKKYIATATNSDPCLVKELPSTEPKQIINLSKANDLALGLFMAYAFFNERHFVFNSTVPLANFFGELAKLKKLNQTVIRVKDTLKISGWEYGILIGFDLHGLCVIRDEGCSIKNAGFVCARKSFGLRE
jgi:hypothetical protein